MIIQFLIFFALLPMLEVLVLMKVGQMIGAWDTVAAILLSGFVGLSLLRLEGKKVIQQVLAEVRRGIVPSRQITEGLVLAIGSVLLILPGFISDAFGIVLLIPYIRSAAAKWIESQLLKKSFLGGVQVNIGQFADDGEYPWSDRPTYKDVIEPIAPAQVIDFATARERLIRGKDERIGQDLDSI